MADAVRLRHMTRQRHDGNLQQLFQGPIAMLRAYAGPYAVQQCFKQMDASMFYECDVMQRPPGSRQWVRGTHHFQMFVC